ncbi:hypothetical protein WAF17_10555 [Bernardetia sp. ABR2-2B]|uniref:hypothetical protein n=1 Tax=Bernardetia sp. ABR2-2B TaxID=3127472 RepID=UPI0030CC3886
MKIIKTTSNLMSKITLLSLLFFFIGLTTTFAQSERGRQMRNKNATVEGKAEKRSQQWQRKFGLNTTQTSQLETAMAEQMRAKNALKGKGNGSSKKDKRQAINNTFDAKVKRIFTPTQYAQYRAMKDDKKAKGRKNKKKWKKKKKNKHKHQNDDDEDDEDDDDF